MFKVQTMLVSKYKKRNDCKILNSNGKLNTSHLGTDEAFKSMDQSIMKKKIMLVKIGLS